MASGSMADALGKEAEARTRAVTVGGTTDGTLAVNERPSTPRQPADMRPRRITSFDPADFPEITGREEEWRFTPLDRLRVLLDGAPSDAHLDWSTDVPAGVEVLAVDADDPVRKDVPEPVDRLSALAMSRAGGAVVVRVPARSEVAEPVVLRLHGTGGDDVVWGHVVLDIGDEAAATVVIEHTGSARYAGCLSVLVGDNAALDLVSVQGWDSDAVHGAHHATRVGRDARFRSTAVTLGGDVVRIAETVEYAGTGGDADLRGLYFADRRQHLEHRLFIDHCAKSCRSNVVYKGALQGDEAHTVWVGDVLIRAEATGTDTYELNRNLLLTDGARADSVPNLEIETGEIVGAGHASATGRFDDEQLFYLQARGIPADEATRMVVRGFFADILGRVAVESIREQLTAAIDDELDRVLT